MPPLSLLLLHEIFPSLPPLSAFLAAGLVISAAVTATARWHGRRRPDAASSNESFGVPWSIPGYSLLFVLGGGLASMVVPFAGFTVMPGYVLMFALAFRSSAFDQAPFIVSVLLIVLASWIFWTLCAAVTWRISRALGWVPAKSSPARLTIGKSTP